MNFSLSRKSCNYTRKFFRSPISTQANYADMVNFFALNLPIIFLNYNRNLAWVILSTAFIYINRVADSLFNTSLNGGYLSDLTASAAITGYSAMIVRWCSVVCFVDITFLLLEAQEQRMRTVKRRAMLFAVFMGLARNWFCIDETADDRFCFKENIRFARWRGRLG